MNVAARLRRIGAGVLCGLSLTGAAHAIVLAYEPFEFGDVAVPAAGQYALGDEDAGVALLGGQNPTIGPTAFYAGPWIQSGGDAQVVKPYLSLSYPGMPPGVGGIQEETVQFDCCTFGRSGREIAGGLGGGPNRRTVYESFLIDFGSQGTDSPSEFGLRGHELWDGGVGDAFRSVTLYLNHFSGINELSLQVDTASGTQIVPVQGGGLSLPVLAASNGGTHLIVMRYDFAALSPDAVSVYLDPQTASEPAVPDAQVVIAASDLFITHHGAYTQFTFSGAGHVPGAIDEIRWASTYGEVVPLPEPDPATGALLGAGAVAWLHRRRRRDA